VTGLASETLRSTRDAIFRTYEYYRSLAADGKAHRGARLASACLPLLVCLALIAAMAPFRGGGSAWLYALFAAATMPAAGFAMRWASAPFGSRLGFAGVVSAWGQSYWATALFLGTLAASHLGAAASGLSPGGIPAWASFLCLTLYLCAGLWKTLFVLELLRFAMGLRGWRFFACLAAFLVLALGYAILSALVFETKIPLL
jgi:hypothetical protein